MPPTLFQLCRKALHDELSTELNAQLRSTGLFTNTAERARLESANFCELEDGSISFSVRVQSGALDRNYHNISIDDTQRIGSHLVGYVNLTPNDCRRNST
jgi:hypothetical protein